MCKNSFKEVKMLKKKKKKFLEKIRSIFVNLYIHFTTFILKYNAVQW